MSSPTSALISATVTPFRWGHLSTSSWRGTLSEATGSLGVEKTRGSSMKFSSSKSKTSNWTSSHFLVLLSLSIVVNDMVVLTPLTPSRFISCSLQKDVLEPPSRKAYVCTVVSLPLALTFTGTTGSPVTEPPTPEKAHCSLSTLTYALWVPMSDCVPLGAGTAGGCRNVECLSSQPSTLQKLVFGHTAAQ